MTKHSENYVLLLPLLINFDNRNNLDMNEWQTQRFRCRCIIDRRNELRRLQMEANNRDTLETNRFLGLTIIEVIAKNWWFQYEQRQIAFITILTIASVT